VSQISPAAHGADQEPGLMAAATDPQAFPHIPQDEQTPAVRLLMAFIEQQQETLQQQRTEIDALKAEVARLKKLPKKPKIRPSTLPKDDDDKPDAPGQGGDNASNKPRKRKKKLIIHHTEVIQPENLPTGSRLLGYENYTVQDLLIQPYNTRYRLARYLTADGKRLIGVLPEPLQGQHFGTTLRSYILYQHHHQRVTQPLILQQLAAWRIAISSGQISRIISEDKESFHTEKAALLRAGINHSRYLQVDDTGSRHDGKNGYCTHIGNASFAWFASTRSKSRINFLELLRGPVLDYTINDAAHQYMGAQKLPREVLAAMRQSKDQLFGDETAWKEHLEQLEITNQRHIRIATEGALLGTLDAGGCPPDLVIISDDAGQFNVLTHALCWIHANRAFERMVPLNETHVEELDWVHTQIWEIYADLQHYQHDQQPDLKQAIETQFDELCRTKTSFATLNQALKRLAKNKKELLLVLERPDIPLHNNLSERDIRAYVIKRKISGSTRSENGRRCRDTFTSLIKTCTKQDINFWDYLGDRLRRENLIPYLPDLLSGKVCLVPSA